MACDAVHARGENGIRDQAIAILIIASGQSQGTKRHPEDHFQLLAVIVRSTSGRVKLMEVDVLAEMSN